MATSKDLPDFVFCVAPNGDVIYIQITDEMDAAMDLLLDLRDDIGLSEAAFLECGTWMWRAQREGRDIEEVARTCAHALRVAKELNLNLDRMVQTVFISEKGYHEGNLRMSAEQMVRHMAKLSAALH